MGNEPIILRFFGCITAFRLSPSPSLSPPLTFPPLIGLCPLLGRIVCALRFNEEKVFENRWIFTHEWWISTIYVDIETKRSSSNILARRGDASSSWTTGRFIGEMMRKKWSPDVHAEKVEELRNKKKVCWCKGGHEREQEQEQEKQVGRNVAHGASGAHAPPRRTRWSWVPTNGPRLADVGLARMPSIYEA